MMLSFSHCRNYLTMGDYSYTVSLCILISVTIYLSSNCSRSPIAAFPSPDFRKPLTFHVFSPFQLAFETGRERKRGLGCPKTGLSNTDLEPIPGGTVHKARVQPMCESNSGYM